MEDNLNDDMKPFVNDFKINLFEIAFLTEEQTKMFKSDFRIVADYFVQIRKNKDYIPTDTQMKHVKEVLQLMSVLTQDNRFEEAANVIEEGDEPKNMCEVLDKVEQRGKEIGDEIGEKIGKEIGEMSRAKKAAINMKMKGYSTKEISEIVEVDIDIINSWFSEIVLI